MNPYTHAVENMGRWIAEELDVESGLTDDPLAIYMHNDKWQVRWLYDYECLLEIAPVKGFDRWALAEGIQRNYILTQEDVHSAFVAAETYLKNEEESK